MSVPRRAARGAIVGLAVEGRNDPLLEGQLLRRYPRYQPTRFVPACEVLTDWMAGDKEVRRLHVLDALVRFANRRPEVVQGAGAQGAVRRLLTEAWISSGASPHPPSAADIERVQLGLVVPHDEPAVTEWDWFVRYAASLGLTSEEVHKPVCVETRATSADGTDCWKVTVEFDTDLKVGDIARWGDPTTWPSCSLFFSAVDTASRWPQPQVGKSDPRWFGTFEEYVDVFNDVWETPLEFAFRQDSPQAFASNYRLLQPTPVFLVDEGVIAAYDTGAPDAPTHVIAVKLVRFVDDLLQCWSGLLCDTLWMDLTIAVALNCAHY